MSKFAKVEGSNHLVRDKSSGAILNINSSEATLARERKQKRMLEKEKQNLLQQEVEFIKKDVSEIKDLLNKILEVSNGHNSN